MIHKMVAITALAWVSSTVAWAPAAAAEKQPNVILILADDLGYGDLAVQGATDIPTPNLDALANSGARFTQAYVTCSVCLPSRVALLTGRYQHHNGFENNPESLKTISGPNWGIPKSETNIAESLKPAGYATAAFGKWQVGWREGYHPNDRGFDEFFGMASGNSYLRFQHPETDESDWAMAKGRGLPEEMTNGRRFELLRQKQVVDEPEYLTDAFARDGANFIDRQAKAGKPFFLYLPFNAVHQPLQATDKYLARFPTLSGGRKTYAAMTSALDDAVGRVVAMVREHGIEENTLIIFLSDNGGPSPAAGGSNGNWSSNGALRGRKNSMYDGGTRVPLFISWKGQIPAGKVFNQLASSLDVLPTILDATGAAHAGGKELDGASLLPVARGTQVEPTHERLFWRYQGHLAVRDAQWKLIRFSNRDPELFNLQEDIGETRNQFESHPEVVAQLDAALEAWVSRFPPGPTPEPQNALTASSPAR